MLMSPSPSLTLSLQPAPVSPLPEQLGQAGEVARVSPPVGAEVVEPRGVGRAPGQQGHPAGAAHRLLSEGVAESDSSGCKFVNVGRECLLVSITSQTWFEIIYDYQENVGRPGRAGE